MCTITGGGILAGLILYIDGDLADHVIIHGNNFR